MDATDHYSEDSTVEELAPGDVRGLFTEFTQSEHYNDGSTSPFVELFVPRTRGKILFALLGTDDALTEAEIVDRADVGRSAAHQHLVALTDTGVVVEAGKRGNAQTYRIRREHPTVQALRMASIAQRHGTTPQLLEEQFIGEPGAGVDPETGEPLDQE